MGKKNEYVFNIGFNKNNPEHRDAANILNQMGHTKADFIAKAVLLYSTHDGQASVNGGTIDYQNLEQMVRKILEEKKEDNRKINILPEENKVHSSGEGSIRESQEPKLEDEDMVGILQVLQGFRK